MRFIANSVSGANIARVGDTEQVARDVARGVNAALNPSWLDQNKSWVIPVGLGVVGLILAKKGGFI